MKGQSKPRAGAVRKASSGKQVGSGGQGRQALEGRKPTPKAEDRPYHPAGKSKAAGERFEAAGGKKQPRRPETGTVQQQDRQRRVKSGDESEMVTGRCTVPVSGRRGCFLPPAASKRSAAALRFPAGW